METHFKQNETQKDNEKRSPLPFYTTSDWLILSYVALLWNRSLSLQHV